MAVLREFKEFAVKGNVMDLAVGVIIGAAFGKIVDSAVNDLIMPLLSRVTGGLDFSNTFVPLRDPPPGTPHTLAGMKAAGVPVFAYGNFLTVCLNFVILAFIVFLMVRTMNRLRRDPATAHPPAPKEEVLLLREIRDAVQRGAH